MENWKHIKTAPIDEWIIVWCGYVDLAIWDDSYAEWSNCRNESVKPTHWISKPNPPSKISKKGIDL